MNTWRVPVSRWFTWSTDDAGGKPDLAFIEPMQRRRLSPLARAALHVANQCCVGLTSVQVVYGSRHGELARTLELLHNLHRGEALSPTTFGLSVLNSAPGLFSIARGDMAAATAVSAGTESFGFGLLEAWTRSKISAAPVLYLYADEAAPAPLGPLPADPAAATALALLLDSSAETALQVQWAAEVVPSSDEPQVSSCIHALRQTKSCWSSGWRQWRWERV